MRISLNTNRLPEPSPLQTHKVFVWHKWARLVGNLNLNHWYKVSTRMWHLFQFKHFRVCNNEIGFPRTSSHLGKTGAKQTGSGALRGMRNKYLGSYKLCFFLCVSHLCVSVCVCVCGCIVCRVAKGWKVSGKFPWLVKMGNFGNIPNWKLSMGIMGIYGNWG